MPDPHTWKPTKAELHKNQWRASRNPLEVSLGSRLSADFAIAAYARHLSAHASGVLVDLGCGKAPYFGIYRDLVTKSVGVDWGSSFHKSDQVDVTCDLNEGIALPDDFADTVLCTDVIEHIYKPARIWSEIARILKPGGKAIVSAPFLYLIHEAPFDYHRYTSYAIHRYAQEAGLESESLEALGGPLFVIADMVCRLARPRPLQAVANSVFGALSTLRRKRTPEDTSYPLHYVFVARKPQREPITE